MTCQQENIEHQEREVCPTPHLPGHALVVRRAPTSKQAPNTTHTGRRMWEAVITPYRREGKHELRCSRPTAAHRYAGLPLPSKHLHRWQKVPQVCKVGHRLARHCCGRVWPRCRRGCTGVLITCPFGRSMALLACVASHVTAPLCVPTWARVHLGHRMRAWPTGAVGGQNFCCILCFFDTLYAVSHSPGP